MRGDHGVNSFRGLAFIARSYPAAPTPTVRHWPAAVVARWGRGRRGVAAGSGAAEAVEKCTAAETDAGTFGVRPELLVDTFLQDCDTEIQAQASGHLARQSVQVTGQPVGTAAWQQVGLSFNFERRQMQTQVARIMPVAEKTLCLSFEIRMPHSSGLLNLAFPAVVSNTILRRLASCPITAVGFKPERFTPDPRRDLVQSSGAEQPASSGQGCPLQKMAAIQALSHAWKLKTQGSVSDEVRPYDSDRAADALSCFG